MHHTKSFVFYTTTFFKKRKKKIASIYTSTSWSWCPKRKKNYWAKQDPNTNSLKQGPFYGPIAPTKKILLGNAPHGVHVRLHWGCTVDPRMIALETIVHHRTVLKIFIMIVYEFWNLDLVPPYMLPQQINSAHVPHLPVHPTTSKHSLSLNNIIKHVKLFLPFLFLYVNFIPLTLIILVSIFIDF